MARSSSSSSSKAASSSDTADAKPALSGDRRRNLDLAVAHIEKQYGKGSIMVMSEDGIVQRAEVIPTGALSLDIALGIGGVPRGRVIEIYGPESSGKTTLALHIVAEAQKAGGVAAYIDAEHALDLLYMKKLGINLEELIISQPDFGEQALDICETLVKSNAVDVIVVDSVPALVPRTELEGEMGDAFVGVQARLMSQAMRKLTGSINKSRAVVVFINQIREKIGVMFGSPETTPGGRALKFYASVRLDIRRISTINEGEKAVGNRVRVKVVKNKLAPPFTSTEVDILFGTGISREGDLLDLAVQQGIIEKSGAWFSHGGERLGQGRENARATLAQNRELAAAIETQVREKHFDPPAEKKDGGGEKEKGKAK